MDERNVDCPTEAALSLTVHSVSRVRRRETWALFAPYHYLRDDLNNGSVCFVAVWDDQPVAFTSAMAMPSAHIKGGWRGHRTVVLPDFQGFGIGSALTDWFGEYQLSLGHRFYVRTTHPRLAAHRRNSPLWRETAKSGRRRPVRASYVVNTLKWEPDFTRVAYSFEYTGRPDQKVLDAKSVQSG
jgi:GNAT superfamily N-acetyltransferase